MSGIVQGAHHDMHGRGQQSMGEGTQLPVAKMRGSEQNALPAPARLLKMLEAFIADPAADIGRDSCAESARR